MSAIRQLDIHQNIIYNVVMPTKFHPIKSADDVPQAILKQLDRVELDSTSRFNHIAFCMNKGRIVSVGRNSYYKTHPWQKELAERAGKRCNAAIHAEVSALVKVKQKVDSIFVFRLSKSGKWLNSRPCMACALAITEAEICCYHS